jgi:hypothetical protein
MDIGYIILGILFIFCVFKAFSVGFEIIREGHLPW